MDGPGFDWLNIPTNSGDNGNGQSFRANAFGQAGSGASSPIPPVSFGIGGNSQNGSVSSFTPSEVTNGHQSAGTNPGPAHTPEITVQRSDSASHQAHNYYFRNNSADQLRANSHQNEAIGQSNSMDSLFHDQSNAEDDYSVPLSLTAQDLTLQESKTYMRWYSDILARTNSRTVTMSDVFSFLNNFKIPNIAKEKLQRIFQKLLYSINIGEFFALLRLISHTLNGSDPKRRLIRIKASVPTPPSILSKKRQNDDDTEADQNASGRSNGVSAVSSQTQTSKPLDLDTFTQFMLTGERPDDAPKKKRSKKLKSVKFSDQIVTDIHDSSFVNSPLGSPMPDAKLDYSLPMDQLLNRIKQQPSQSHYNADEEEKKVLEEMEPQINHFQNLHAVDTASIDGVPASIDFHDHHLKPNMTGPAQMAQMFSPSPEPELLKPNMTGPAQMEKYYNSDPSLRDDVSPLRPNATGPLDMARIFTPNAPGDEGPQQSQQQDAPRISLQSFTSQMTGNTFANTVQNARVSSDGSPSRPHASSVSNRPLPPPPVPNTRRSRSASSPTPRMSSPLSNPYNGQNNQYGSSNLSVPNQPPTIPPRSPLSNSQTGVSPSLPSSPNPTNSGRIPPPPPPSRRRNTSLSAPNNPPAQGYAPPLPPKVGITSQPQYQQASTNNPYSTGGTASQVYSGGNSSNDSTANILDDLKALQEEVDKIRDMTGGF